MMESGGSGGERLEDRETRRWWELLSKLAEKSLPFFKTLKKCTKKSEFQRIAKAKMAFKQMKKLIAELPMLTAPEEKEEPIIYLAAAKEAISVVLMTERDGKQMPVCFVSRALQGPEINYTPIEKLIRALILSNPEVTRRLLKWSFELEEHDISSGFQHGASEDDPTDTPMKDKELLSDLWILFTDGSSCIDGSGAGIILTSPKGMEFTYAIRTYIAKEPCMIKYLEKVKNLTNTFKEFSIKQIPRGENKKVDVLSKMASTSFAHLSKQVLVEELKEKSIDEKEVLAVVEEEGRTWMTPIFEYLTEEILPEEKRKARAICRKAGRYVVANGILCKRSFLGPWLRCIGPLQGNYVLREIHEGSCIMHIGLRSVVAKALRSGYLSHHQGPSRKHNIVLKGNNAKSMTTDKDGNLKVRPPVTTKEHQQVQREENARTILLSALLNKHMGDFYHMIDARDIWNAIKARFDGNAESKKMQKSLLKQKFEEFKISEEEGLDKGYDKMQKI
nr:reverse transcriptase domain-containing protein [Tanacetum cinerariifolium]GEY96991.1 reverse transcriptase domain-containing protein [Tanacetum cinerariifolium]